MSHTVQLLGLAFNIQHEGKSVQFKLKANVFEDDSVTFDLRRVIAHVISGRKDLDLNNLIKRDLVGWFVDLRLFGYTRNDTYFPSRRTAMANDPNNMHDKVLSLHTTSAVGMIVLLLFLSVARWKNSEKAKASSVLASLVAATCTAEYMIEFWEDCCSCGVDDLSRCTDGAYGGKCMHVRSSFTEVEWQTHNHHHQLVASLVSAFSHRNDCPTLLSWLPQVFDELCRHIDAVILERQVDVDLLRDDDKPMRGKKRLLHICDDTRQAVSGAVQSGRAPHCRAMLKSIGGFSSKVGLNIESRELREFNAQGLILGKELGDMHVAPDATRCGNPAEDSFQVPCWLDRPQKGLVLPCMVKLLMQAYF
jgi:hypothetical protein